MGCIFSVEEQRKVIYAGRNMMDSSQYYSKRTLDSHILTYVLEGECNLKIGDKIVQAKKDCVFLQSAKIPFETIKKSPDKTATMYIHFAPNLNDSFFSSPPEDMKPPFVYVNTLVDASNNIEIKRNFIRLIESYDSGDTVRQSAHLNIILNDLSKNHLYEDSAYALAMKIKKLVNDAIPHTLTNKEIAKSLNVSVRTAETTFKKCFDMSIHQYLIYRRVELAKFWLKFFPEQKISVTSSGLGFFDEYHFSRQFKAVTGMSPTEYKNMFISKDSAK